MGPGVNSEKHSLWPPPIQRISFLLEFQEYNASWFMFTFCSERVYNVLIARMAAAARIPECSPAADKFMCPAVKEKLQQVQ